MTDLSSGKLTTSRCGDHGFDAWQRFRLRGVDRLDAGVRMRAAQHLAPDHAGHVGVGGKRRASRDLVGAVGPDGTLADPLVVGDDVHCAASPHVSGGFHHRAHDLVVTGAPAEIAGEPEANFFLARIRILLQQRIGRDQHARGADATLQRRHFQELLLQRMQMIALGHAFDGARSRGLRASTASIRQEQTSRSSSVMLQAPQSPEAQPSFEPVRPSGPRRTSSMVS